MTVDAVAEVSPWTEALRAASLFAVDPPGTGGVVLRALPGPVRERWMQALRERLAKGAAPRRVPLHVPDGRLLGGLDLAATLRAGRPVAERGLLAEADGGVLVLAMAERLSAGFAARLARVLDAGEGVLERDGLAERFACRVGVVALDEGVTDDERTPAALRERLAFHLDLGALGVREAEPLPAAATLDAARALLPEVEAPEAAAEALCAAALALGIDSVRAPLLALRTARAAAALEGRTRVEDEDVATAARLVLAPRATALPASAADEEEPAEPEPGEAEARDEGPPEDASSDAEPDADAPADEDSLAEVVLAAAQAAVPSGLLERIRAGTRARPRASAASGAGARREGARRGRPAGVRRGEPGRGARLSVVETLRAAAPWQPLRRREASERAHRSRGAAHVEVRREDFRVHRFRERSETTVLFVVDASGSAALHRLAEAKGAVERLLAESYVRRDRVALLAFRGHGAELLLPPTRSLVRARRCLASLPGGGGTPMAAALEASAALARGVARSGGTPLCIFLTDGHANVARDGTPGRARATEDALAAARLFREEGLGALLVDTSPRPRDTARTLADAMDASYLALPRADSGALCRAVREATAGPARGAPLG